MLLDQHARLLARLLNSFTEYLWLPSINQGQHMARLRGIATAIVEDSTLRKPTVVAMLAKGVRRAKLLRFELVTNASELSELAQQGPLVALEVPRSWR